MHREAGSSDRSGKSVIDIDGAHSAASQGLARRFFHALSNSWRSFAFRSDAWQLWLFFGGVLVEPVVQLLFRRWSTVDDQSIAEFERLFS